MENDFPTYPGERAIVLADRRQEWWTGLGATAVVFGIAIGGWLVLSSPQNASSLAETVVPAADAATLFNSQATQAAPAPVTTAETTAKVPLTTGDVVQVQGKLKALGFDPGKADGQVGPLTLKALNGYRKSVGLQPVTEIDREAVAQLTP